jgi:2',3'-cyclic-nucleotide 2'-phosphodiesterase (5'-nucleotidase family)
MPGMRPAMRILAVLLAATAACSGSPAATETAVPAQPPPPAAAPPRKVTLAVIGTSDLHGHIEKLPYLAGHIANLRAAREVDEIVLVDGGDMFQGTLESNLNEGAAVIEAYNHIGYAAAAIGNHEFDFGPAGERPVPADDKDDPRGALKARAAEARFPLLGANLLDGDRPVSWPNVAPSVLVERAGVRIGIIGVTTESTPRTTSALNFVGLSVAPLAATIAAEAAALRQRGARVVLVAAHAGGVCRELDDPARLDSCRPDEEIFQVARALPAGAVDVIVGGHTHQAVAHDVAGIAIVQSYANGAAFGRVDLVIDPAGGAIERRIHPPHFVCGEDPVRRAGAGRDMATEERPCQPDEYAGRAVAPDDRLAALLERHVAAAREVKSRELGVVLDSAVRRSYREESALGNLFADLMRAARPGADVAITNGGGLRADLPAGPLTYGALYQAMPFDNRFAKVKLTGEQLGRIIAANMKSGGGIFSLSGMRAQVRCRGSEIEVTLRRASGARVRDSDRLVLVTSDFLAAGGDGMLADAGLAESAIRFESGANIRDAMAEALRARGGRISGDDRRLRDPDRPRVALPGPRPVQCP